MRCSRKYVFAFRTDVDYNLIFTTAVVSFASYDDPVVAIGDITRIKGIRENQLFGFGLVIGLNGTGDSSNYQPTILAHSIC